MRIITFLRFDFDGLILQDEERMVTREEGLAFAEEAGCLFLESSAKTRENVEKCFEELALKVCRYIRHNNA